MRGAGEKRYFLYNGKHSIIPKQFRLTHSFDSCQMSHVYFPKHEKNNPVFVFIHLIFIESRLVLLNTILCSKGVNCMIWTGCLLPELWCNIIYYYDFISFAISFRKKYFQLNPDILCHYFQLAQRTTLVAI